MWKIEQRPTLQKVGISEGLTGVNKAEKLIKYI